MLRHRKLLFLSVFLIVAAAVAVVVYQRIERPAKAVLLLPDGNFILYVNFSPAHFFDLGQMPMQSDPQYQEFVQQTGFHFEHDLDTIAISQQSPGDMDSESSAVFSGSFDQERMSRYLQKLSTGNENYAGRTIFSIPQEGHTVRACIVDAKTVAVTNTQSAESIHNIIDKARGLLLAGSGPSLVRDHYDDVPFASLAWAMFHVPAESGAPLPGGINADFLKNSVSVISVRYTGSVRVKAEVISANESEAAQVLEAANTFLVLAKGAEESFSPGGPDKDVKAVFDSIKVQKEKNRTVLSAVIPQAFVQKMAARLKN
jgi:hypothetical protein